MPGIMKTKYLKPVNIFAGILVFIIIFCSSCYKEEIVENEDVIPGEGLADWTSETHSSDASPNYSIVFPQDKVNRIDIVIDSDDWQFMLDDLTENIGPFGSGKGMSKSPVFASYGYDGPPPPPVFFTPVFVTCSLFFEGREWYNGSTGNCYKPEGRAGTFAYGTFNTANFDLKTNEDIADYSDVRALYNILHSNIRNTDIEKWKSDIESVFDVDHFMKWLATNTVIQNWDSYGIIGHNYYLYNNPYTNKMAWIPWDNNEALTSLEREPLSLSMTEVTGEWPLIRYLMDQPEYEEIYKTYLQSVIDDAFESSKMKELYQYYHNLIYDYVIGSDGEQPGYTFLRYLSEFTDALTYQMNHVDERYNAVINYLSK